MNGRYLTIVLAFSVILGFFTPAPVPSCGASSEIKHVILIVLDGVKPDTLVAANTPNIDNLVAEGSYTWNAATVTPSITIAAIPSIFTGATPDVHEVTDWEGGIRAETIVEVFEEAGLSTAIIGQDPILGGYSATYCTGFYYHHKQYEYFTTIAINWFTQHEPFFLTTYDPVPDLVAHKYGEQSDEYREAIEDADFQIGRIMNMLRELDVYEQTLIVITTDHGMTGRSHGSTLPTDMRIFSIFKGPRVKKGFEMEDVVFTPELGYAGHRIIDIAPTITVLAGLRTPANSEGRVIYQIFAETDPVLASVNRTEATGVPEDNLDYMVVVTNLTSKPENYRIEITSEKGWPVEFSPQRLTLEPGESGNVVVRVPIPDLKESSEDTLLARVVGTEASTELEFKATGKPLETSSEVPLLLPVTVVVFLGGVISALVYYRFRSQKKMSLKSKVSISVCLLLTISICIHSLVSPVHSWDYETHQFVASNAIYLMPVDLDWFFQTYSITIENYSNKPDSWKYSDNNEQYRHWYDVDIPHGEYDYVDGVLPWAVEDNFNTLVQYLSENDLDHAAQLAGVISHYIADASQPLHATSDHDPGGKHTAFESTVDFQVRKDNVNVDVPGFVPYELDNIFDSTMQLLNESYSYTSILNPYLRSGILWNDEIKNITENRLRTGAQLLANIWYTAIVQSGISPPPTTPPPSSTNYTPYIVGGVLVVAVISIVIMLYMRRR